jgi:hypothetical protein
VLAPTRSPVMSAAQQHAAEQYAAQQYAAQQHAGEQYAGLGALTTIARSDTPAQVPIMPEYIPEQPGQAPPQGIPRQGRDMWRAPWLPVILLGQALLSLRLIWSNTAFQDEALYLWAGHRVWSNWLYGAPVPGFPSYFSGAPVVYPPLGALADTYGGLAGARLLSLAFMLLATLLLYLTARRIFDRRSALFAVCLFAGLGATQFLGALATYDAMAIALLALATCLGFRAADLRPRHRTTLLVLAGSALALADATKYAAALFDPVVIAAVMAFGWRQRGRRFGLAAAAVPLLTMVAILAAAVLIGGHPYWHGIMSTTLARSSGDVASAGVLYVSATWAGGVMLLALIGTAVVFVIAPRWEMRCLSIVLAGAAFLAPAEQARIHTITSLFKHIGFGAWFGCVVAGFALASLLDVVPTTKVAAAARVGLAAAVLSALAGTALASSQFDAWPNSAAFTADLRRAAVTNRGPILESNSIPQYYVPDLWFRNEIGTVTFSYPDSAKGSLSGPRAYADAIRHGFFSIIALDDTSTLRQDVAIRQDIHAANAGWRARARATRYVQVASMPFVASGFRGYFRIWILGTAKPDSKAAAHHDHRKQH